jgi:copper chaperone NosL
MIRNILFAVLVAVPVAACRDDQAAEVPPAPAEITAESVGHYCGMLLADHEGPKGQIHLAGVAAPVWFSSVRDTFAFTRLPEEPKGIRAIYVHDLARAVDWAHPEPGAWVEARQAWYVVGSSRRGGMGGDEALPFSDETAARAFAADSGGDVIRFDQVPDSFVFGTAAPEVVHGQH